MAVGFRIIPIIVALCIALFNMAKRLITLQPSYKIYTTNNTKEDREHCPSGSLLHKPSVFRLMQTGPTTTSFF